MRFLIGLALGFLVPMALRAMRQKNQGVSLEVLPGGGGQKSTPSPAAGEDTSWTSKTESSASHHAEFEWTKGSGNDQDQEFQW